MNDLRPSLLVSSIAIDARGYAVFVKSIAFPGYNLRLYLHKLWTGLCRVAVEIVVSPKFGALFGRRVYCNDVPMIYHW